MSRNTGGTRLRHRKCDRIADTNAHITEPRRNGGCQTRQGCVFNATLDVVEPMGMETLVYFNVGGTQVCGRVSPENAGAPGEAMLLDANVDHMHLIDPETDLVL